MHKTINEEEDVRNHIFSEKLDGPPYPDSDEIETLAILAKRPESGILPPVVPYKSFSSKNLISSPNIAESSHSEPAVRKSQSGVVKSPRRKVEKHHRKANLHRSKTINVPESHNGDIVNGASSIYHEQVLVIISDRK